MRPSYPEPLFDELMAYSGLHGRSGARVLEIGPGTGKATASLLARGLRVAGVEPGENLARFVAEKFAANTQFSVVNARFEDVSMPDAAFDLVFAATAFHWVDASVRLPKTHRLLRDGGVIAVVMTNQVSSDVDRGYFERSQYIYAKHGQGVQGEPVPTPDDVTPPEHRELAQHPSFGDIVLRRYRWDQTYTSEQYADLLRSYSGSGQMSPDAREALISDLCALIDREFGGHVTRPLVMTLSLGRKR